MKVIGWLLVMAAVVTVIGCSIPEHEQVNEQIDQWREVAESPMVQAASGGWSAIAAYVLSGVLSISTAVLAARQRQAKRALRQINAHPKSPGVVDQVADPQLKAFVEKMTR